MATVISWASGREKEIDRERERERGNGHKKLEDLYS